MGPARRRARQARCRRERTFDPEPLPTPPAETITLAPPSPTVEPVERGIEPTAFSAALPDTVLDLALAEMTEGGIFDDADPLESYTLVLSDGGSRSVTVYAAQFQDVEATAAGWPELVADEVEQGEVTADGTVVGEWVFAAVHSETGEPAILWRNSTALLLVTGEEQLVRDVFRAFRCDSAGSAPVLPGRPRGIAPWPARWWASDGRPDRLHAPPQGGTSWATVGWAPRSSRRSAHGLSPDAGHGRRAAPERGA